MLFYLNYLAELLRQTEDWKGIDRWSAEQSLIPTLIPHYPPYHPFCSVLSHNFIDIPHVKASNTAIKGSRQKLVLFISEHYVAHSVLVDSE